MCSRPPSRTCPGTWRRCKLRAMSPVARRRPARSTGFPIRPCSSYASGSARESKPSSPSSEPYSADGEAERKLPPAMKAERNPVRDAAAFVDIDQRAKRRQDSIQVPKPVEGNEGLFVVDATWGTIYPMQLAPGVRTVAELEVIAHLKNRLPLIDTRLTHFHEDSTITGASLVP